MMKESKFSSLKLLEQVFGQEFVAFLTCLTVFKILLKNEITAGLIIFQLTVRKTC